MSHDPRFSIIPGWIVTDPRLKARDLQVLCLLGRHTDKHGWCRRSQVKMAAQLACARSTVQLSLDRLADLGVVEKHEEESSDGRDSAHSYRVIYDRAPPSGYDFDAYLDGDTEEYDPTDCVEMGGTPADISAPPADPESAPPADLGSAPIKDPSLTTPSERERGSAREGSEESRQTIERKFKRWYPTYPGYDYASEKAARDAWFSLSDMERAECIERTPAYVAAGKAAKAKFVFPSVYLGERKWRQMDDPKSEFAPPMVHNPFSRAWMAMRLAELSKPMSTTGWPALTAFQATQSRDAEMAKQIERERKARYGWPKVHDMHAKAERATGVTVPGPILVLSEGFEKVHRDSAMAGRWRALHDRMGWPWLPMTGHEWFYFPPGEPEEAMAEFQRRLNEGKGDVDAA